MTNRAEQAAQEARERADLLRELKGAREIRDVEYAKSCEALVALIQLARENGATWPLIAEAMAMTPNGVRHFIRQHG